MQRTTQNGQQSVVVVVVVKMILTSDPPLVRLTLAGGQYIGCKAAPFIGLQVFIA